MPHKFEFGGDTRNELGDELPDAEDFAAILGERPEIEMLMALFEQADAARRSLASGDSISSLLAQVFDLDDFIAAKRWRRHQLRVLVEALVEIDDDGTEKPAYLKMPFRETADIVPYSRSMGFVTDDRSRNPDRKG
jgi:hypothetical protein